VRQPLAQSYTRYYFAIFLLAASTLSYQILITRFFSVVLFYHFAFGAISLAMLGLTRGAMEVYSKPDRYASERVGVEFALHASWFAISSVGAVIVFLGVPVVVPAPYLLVALSIATVAFVMPFTEAGVCITLLLTRLPYGGGWLYAADLSGAAVGCLGIIFALLAVDPVSATLWIGAIAAAAGWIAAGRGGDARSLRLSGAVALTLVFAAAVHTGLTASGRSHLGVMWAKGHQQTGTLFERWNTYSRVRVTALGQTRPFGWGFAHTPQTKVDQDYLDIDADASTVITRQNGDIGKLSYLKDDVINAAYLVQSPTDVAVIGVGGGRDVLSALLFGAKHILGIEINPAIFEVLTNKFGDFSGHLDRAPGVSLVNAEARSYINHSSNRFDLVQISLIDTWAATAAGGLALTENRLYTVEAWDDFYRVLKPGGLLSVSRWYKPDGHRSEFYRLVSIAASALQRRGVPAGELSRHIIAVNVGEIVTVISRPDAFTDAQWQGARDRLTAQGFTILLGPDVPFDEVISTVLAGKADAAFFNSLPENIAPSTDDDPFFFYTARLGDLFDTHTHSSVSMNNNAALFVTRFLVIIALCACGYYIAIPLFRLARRTPLSTLAPPLAYFSSIGMGFMLIEISQLQRLTVFLGHPVYALGVVLFTILLFSGIGSATLGARTPPPNAIAARLAALLTTLVAAGVLTPVVTAWARSGATDLRILVSVLLLAPPAFCMGMMFPLGLSVWRRHSELLPFFWSANGITSTLASVLGMALSIEFGITKTYELGVCFYVVCALMIAGTRKARLAGVSEAQPPKAWRFVTHGELAQ
jgi:SAM-dependent methyltransferase